MKAQITQSADPNETKDNVVRQKIRSCHWRAMACNDKWMPL